jgi:hypothetical protein
MGVVQPPLYIFFLTRGGLATPIAQPPPDRLVWGWGWPNHPHGLRGGLANPEFFYFIFFLFLFLTWGGSTTLVCMYIYIYFNRGCSATPLGHGVGQSGGGRTTPMAKGVASHPMGRFDHPYFFKKKKKFKQGVFLKLN